MQGTTVVCCHRKKALDIRKRLARHNPDRYEPDYAMSLGNYADRLDDMRQNDQALITAKKALGIYQRLAQQNPDGYEPFYANLLFNFANHLNGTGQNDQALITAKKALDIMERLSQQNPDRYEPGYADSLSLYFELLCDVGKYTQAIAVQSQIIEMSQRFYQKLPQKHAFDFATRHLLASLAQWLVGESAVVNLAAVDEDLLQYLEVHDLPVIKSFRLFVEALSTSEANDPTTTFAQILSLHQPMSQAQKNQTEQEYHCAAAWLYHQGVRDDQMTQWPAQWQAFKDQRQGNVPVWMLDFATKLAVEWP
jgi:tetratricopeptide (TPR) repeat protein